MIQVSSIFFLLQKDDHIFCPNLRFWIKSIPAVHEWFNRMVQKRLFPLLQREFPDFCSSSASKLCPLVVDNAYVFKYTPETGRRTGVHTDSGCLSFTISLGGAHEGGGTWIEGLGTIQMQPGHVTVRPGGVRHCGQAVTEGTRYIIGGFCMHAGKVEYTRMLIGLGADLAEKGEFEKAKDVLEAAVMINPKFDGAYTHLASAYQKLNRPDKARDVLEYCLRCVNPVNGEVAFTLGMQYFKAGDLEYARKCLLDVCLHADDCDVDSMMALAQMCSQQGKTDEECKWYERIISTPGASKVVVASACSNLGALKEGKDEEIQLYRKALDLVSNNFQIRYSLGSALGAKEEWAAAAHAFRLAVESAEDEDMQLKSLKNLYTVAVKQIQQETPPASREEMIEKLQQIMGLENYNRLAANAAGR
jgi:tetratricopeptide (TPR) repeat protein